MYFIDWIVVATICFFTMLIGLFCARSSNKQEGGFFTADRSLTWWSIGISNSATYQSGLGGFVMLIFLHGFSGNWLWWTSWIFWMPLVAIVWSRMWRRMQVVTTAELISLRYGGKYVGVARKLYALSMSIFAMTIIAYVTGFFAKTISPLVTIDVKWILLIFGGITVLYTMFGGLMGSVMVAVAQMVIMIGGSLVFLFLIIPQFGGWTAILDKVQLVRPNSLSLNPLSDITPPLTMVMFVILGLFFAGSPTSGEGMTAQRFMAAKNERHAIGGQLFNTFIALSLRIIPLLGLGIICMGIFWHPDLVKKYGAAPEGFTVLNDPAYAWGELIKASKLPTGFVGLLVASEVAAYMSTLSALINWGASFLVNDFYKSFKHDLSHKQETNISRIVSFIMFLVSAIAAVLFVDDMVSWFLFINSVLVIFWLPLAYYRFFWSRFNIWGELASTVLGIPMAFLIWFVLDFQNKPIWMGTGLLFVIAMAMLAITALLTPPETKETLDKFFISCRPPAGWRKQRKEIILDNTNDPPLRKQIFDCVLGIIACGALGFANNALFIKQWPVFFICLIGLVISTSWLLKRCLGTDAK